MVAETPSAPTPPGVESGWKTRFGRGLVFLRPDLAKVAGIVALTFLVSLLGALEPLALKFVIDGLIADDGLRTLGYGLLALALLLVGKESLGAIANAKTWKVRLRTQQRILEQTVGRLHSLPVQFHKEQGVGAVMTRLDRGISGYMQAVHALAFEVLPALVYLIAAAVLMIRLDWRLALVVFAFVPWPALVGARAAREQVERERGLMDLWASIYARFNEVLGGIVTVKSFAREDAEKRRFLDGVAEANDLVQQGVGRDSRNGAVRNVIAGLASIGALAAGGWLVARGGVSVGTVVAFLGYVATLFRPVQGLTGIYQTLRKAGVSLDAIFSILDTQDALGDAADAVDPVHVKGAVSFDDVHFGYPPDKAVLRGVTLEVAAGERIALVGPSGSGKTTLMALLQRLYDPTAGSIRLDGLDLRAVKQHALRRAIGVVLQDALVFNESVANVIAYARPDAAREEIEAVAVAANAHDFIVKLPRGYDTLLGERGGLLSTGERQRVAIARALLKKPAIVVLDEATSALDAETEALVQGAIDRLTAGRTTFMIAHRLATIVHADRIVVLREGRVSEVGSHRELLAGNGYYADLVRHQTRGLLS